MNFASRIRRAGASIATVVALAATPALAQDISESHLKAARAAVSALNATAEFDAFLPSAGAQLKAQLTQRNPDLVAVISKTVDEVVLEHAPRRSDLEREAATIYARVFTEQQLNEISAFYNTETGKKLMSDGEIVGRQTLEAADIWQRGVARDIAASVNEKLKATIASQPQAPLAGSTIVAPSTPVQATP